MKSKIIFLPIFMLILNASCTTTVQQRDLTIFPIEPDWQVYNRPPVLSKVVDTFDQDNFVVSDEFVEKSIQQTKYIERVKRWRVINNIP